MFKVFFFLRSDYTGFVAKVVPECGGDLEDYLRQQGVIETRVYHGI